jgi:hypothetical protein
MRVRRQLQQACPTRWPRCARRGRALLDPSPLRQRPADWDSARVVWVQLDFDGHACVLVTAGLRLACVSVTADHHFDAASITEVAPPLLALGPTDVDDHSVASSAVADRECVAAATATAGDSDQGQTAA